MTNEHDAGSLERSRSRQQKLDLYSSKLIQRGLALANELQTSTSPADSITVASESLAHLPELEFEVVTVDISGTIIKREKKRNRYWREDLGGGVFLDLMHIPEGRFQMGSPEDEVGRRAYEGPQHCVQVAPFFMGHYPVTQAQWRAVASLPPINYELELNPSYFKGDGRPVEQVNWYEVVEFCARLSHQTGQTYRLPSEAEWEYACRAGTTTPFHFGETITTELANYGQNETNEVERFPANAFGLHDMHGNVWEWCLDNWHENYNGAPADGLAWPDAEASENSHVRRGGSWLNLPRNCRSAYRYGYDADFRNYNFGFRVVYSPS